MSANFFLPLDDFFSMEKQITTFLCTLYIKSFYCNNLNGIPMNCAHQHRISQRFPSFFGHAGTFLPKAVSNTNCNCLVTFIAAIYLGRKAAIYLMKLVDWPFSQLSCQYSCVFIRIFQTKLPIIAGTFGYYYFRFLLQFD